ncbi:E3 ubiquitin-protein ligase TRIM71-like [Ruditapes philippinarum]|uniref:E3 ubiquitin-protein ligase TRIM71-like n=1 Tax=Ruditapes philippinarum TaxID=129788 RepID=UPI00295ADFD1|nr:E3 ubiquitin-protein ligase TRIM71-like [Ruditapes philippinarum]
MDVSGKIIADTQKIPILYCLPCDQDGLKVPAYGYCQDCKEHLCKNCFENHKRPKPCRNHILLDKDAMPTQQTTVNKSGDELSENCSKHTDKPLEFHCNNHKTVACYVCVTLEHKQCKVDYIPEISGNVSGEWIKFNKTMEVLVKKCENNIMEAAVAAKQLEQSQKKFVEDIRLFREEINDRLDQMELMMMAEAEAIVNTANNKLENIQVVCEKIAEEVKRSQSFLQALKEANKHNKLFIELKNVRPRVMTLKREEVRAVQDYMTFDDIQFDRNEKLLDQLKKETNFGTISTYGKPSADNKLYLQYERSFNVTFPSDKRESNVSGAVMISVTQMILGDKGNRKIKTIDVDTGTLVSEKNMSSRPNDVIILPHNKLAIALPDEKCIQVMSYTDTSLSTDRRIDVGEQCFCLAYCQDKLVVGCNCNPGKLVILDLDGNMIQVLDTPGLFDGPQKIVISSDEKFMYVSDYSKGNGKCMEIGWQGNVVQQFRNDKYFRPEGIQKLAYGTLLIFTCYEVIRLSRSFKKCEYTGLKNMTLSSAQYVAYSESNRKLYVSCSSPQKVIEKDTISVINVKWSC